MKSEKSSNSLVNKLFYLAVPLVMLTAGCSLNSNLPTRGFRMYSADKEQIMNPNWKNPENITKKYQDSIQARYEDSLLTLYNSQQALTKKIQDNIKYIIPKTKKDSSGYTILRATFPLRR